MANQSKNTGSSNEHNDSSSNQHRGDNANRDVNTSGMAIPVIEEELQVGKEVVETGAPESKLMLPKNLQKQTLRCVKSM